jgi:hypothetical protein
MRLTARQLTAWSFLMSSVDGAGLMLLPLLVSSAAPMPGIPAMPAMPGMPGMPGMAPAPDHTTVIFSTLTQAAAVTLVHTLAMITVAGVVAVLVYRVVGLRILRTAWVNVGPLWACCLVGAGIMTMLFAG